MPSKLQMYEQMADQTAKQVNLRNLRSRYDALQYKERKVSLPNPASGDRV